MNKKILIIIIVVVAAIVIGFGTWTILPLFTNTTIDEPLPTLTTTDSGRIFKVFTDNGFSW